MTAAVTAACHHGSRKEPDYGRRPGEAPDLGAKMSSSWPVPAGSLSGFVDAAIHAAREGAAVILHHYRQTGADSVRYKEDSSPLTAADRGAHEAIVRVLRQYGPGIPILSEEACSVPYAERAGWQRYWLVDPLDGTKGFIRRSDEFTVNIALMENATPVVGLVYAPARLQLYAAIRGSGAYRWSGEADPVRLATAPARPDRLRLVASRNHAGPAVQRLLQRATGAHAVSLGSALKFCLIAEGTADFYYRDSPTMEWDTAAGQCILEEAGGTVRTVDGQPLTYNKPDLKNPPFVATGDPTLDWAGLVRGSSE